jgi:hypothetical protein
MEILNTFRIIQCINFYTGIVIDGSRWPVLILDTHPGRYDLDTIVAVFNNDELIAASKVTHK